jgi:hypothetical protein
MARNMSRFASVARVPRPFLPLCRRDILVMEYLPGQKLFETMRTYGEEMARARGVSFDQLREEMMSRIRVEGLPPPYQGPGPWAIELYRWLCWTRNVIVRTPSLTMNAVLDSIYRTGRYAFHGKQPESNDDDDDDHHHQGRRSLHNPGTGSASPVVSTTVSSSTVSTTHVTTRSSYAYVPVPRAWSVPPNVAHIMRTLLQVSGHQLLVDGTFNADPHAGNFLLLPDGKLGLIDMGQVKRLSDSERIEICKYLAVLGEKGVSTALRKQRVATLGLQHGYQSRDLNPDVMYNMVRFGLDQDGPEVTGGRNVQQFMDEQYARDPWSKTDDMLIMPIRFSFMLRGVGLTLGHPVSTLEHWYGMAKGELDKIGWTTAELDGAFTMTLHPPVNGGTMV